MKIEQIYTGCLAQGAYYIESEGEAVIIDPLRDTAPYLEKAQAEGATIRYILETHFHADFVSGHVDLAEKTGATIVYGPTASTQYDIHVAADEEVLNVGNISIKVLHTPGHTPESSSFLLYTEDDQPHALFSGDTLFIGDVGRPDLAVKSDLSREDLAALLFDSLRNKIMPLPDSVIVYPAHGAGSACGKNMSKETWDTLGHQKEVNYALRADMTKAEFVEEVTRGILPPPQYFAKNAKINKEGYDSIDTVLNRGTVALDVETFESIANHEGAIVLDTRHQDDFAKGFIPKSIFIGLDGNFASWVGTLVTDIKQPIILVTEPGKEEEAVTRLARVGYDQVLGYLQGGIHAWNKAGKELDALEQASAHWVITNRDESDDFVVLDVRKPTEFTAEHLKGAENFPLDYINNQMESIDRGKAYHLYCQTGYRSVVTASILKARGFEKLVDIAGGFEALQAAGAETTEYICPSTLS